MVSKLNVLARKADDPSLVFNQIKAYIESGKEDLYNRFLGMYKEDLEEGKGFPQLYEDLSTGKLYSMLDRVVPELKAELTHYNQRKQAILDQREGLSKTDPEWKNLTSDLKNVNAAIKLFNRRQILEHLTNMGILPNYAFPESGVQLNAGLRRWTGKEGEFENIGYEIIRPASTAIREMGPGNHYYARKNRFPINGINILNWEEEALEYRFCSRCDHLAPHDGKPTQACPKCGHNSWQSDGNKKKFVRMQRMNSFVDSEEAAVGDGSEERLREPFFINRHFRISAQSSNGALLLKDIPFGVEYLQSVEVYEVNVSAKERFDKSRQIKIMDREVPESGHVVCRGCGRISDSSPLGPRGPKQARAYHFGYCKHRDVMYPPPPDTQVFEEIFLYRKIQTEALKILLPVQELDSEAQIKMFRAGLMLGLRKFYNGNPQHLSIWDYSEYNPQTQKRDRFLMLFDTIPGGTGYLNQLFNQDAFSQVLRKAYLEIQTCSCQTEGKDGCYRCIYTYANQYERAEISRLEAEKVFERINENLDQWVEMPEGFGNVPDDGRVEESELERWFVKLLKQYCQDAERRAKGWVFREVREQGKIRYHLDVPSGDWCYKYEVEPQVSLGKGQGVVYPTRPDFMIRPRGALGPQGPEPDEMLQVLPIAVYLDGFYFHATVGQDQQNRFLNDLKRRDALLGSDKYWTWSLTWKDLEIFEKEPDPHTKKDYSDQLAASSNGEIIRQMSKAHPEFPKMNAQFLNGRNSMERLLGVLSYPFGKELERNAKGLLFSFQKRNGAFALGPQQLNAFISYPDKDWKHFLEKPRGDSWFWLDHAPAPGRLSLRLVQAYMDLKVKGKFLIQELPEGGWEKQEWEAFWQYYNLFQFVDGVELMAVPSFQPEQDPVASRKGGEPKEIAGLEEWDEIYHPLIRVCHEKQWHFGQKGYFYLTDEENTELGSAFFGIREKKMVFDPLDEDSKKAFETAGYQVLDPASVDVDKLAG